MRKIFLKKIYQRKHRHFTLDYIYSSDRKSKLVLSNEQFCHLKDAYMQVTRTNASTIVEDESINTSLFNYIVSSKSKRKRVDEPVRNDVDSQGKRNSSALVYSSFADIMVLNGLSVFATHEVFSIFDMDRDKRVNYLEFVLNLYPFVDRYLLTYLLTYLLITYSLTPVALQVRAPLMTKPVCSSVCSI